MEEELGNVYELEKIIGERKTEEGQREYLLKWKNYGLAEATWEPEANLLHCKEALETWKREQVENVRKRPAGWEVANAREPLRKKQRARVIIKNFTQDSTKP